jgi:membrane protein
MRTIRRGVTEKRERITSICMPGENIKAHNPDAMESYLGRKKALQLVFHRMMQMLRHLRDAIWTALLHDVLSTAKAAAYSGILMLFPTVLVLTTVLALSPGTNTIRGEIRGTFEQILPTDTMQLVQSYFQSRPAWSVQVLFSATGLSIFAAMGVMLSLMEGFRKSYRLPKNAMPFWKQRLTAILLIPTCLVPMAFATLLIVFGHQIEKWMIDNADHSMQFYVLLMWRITRWTIALATSVTVLGIIFHFGTRREESWWRVLPGAIISSMMWFSATLLFGLYVTRFADYSLVYGSLGAAIATLVWLYITFFSILIGAEFNAQMYKTRLGLNHGAVR